MLKSKPKAALIIAEMKKERGNPPPAPAGPDDSGSGSSQDEGLVATADELISALDSKDPSAVAEALKSFMEQC